MLFYSKAAKSSHGGVRGNSLFEVFGISSIPSCNIASTAVVNVPPGFAARQTVRALKLFSGESASGFSNEFGLCEEFEFDAPGPDESAHLS